MEEGKQSLSRRTIVMVIAAVAWTVMVGAASARYMMAQGYVDQHALKQRADNVKEFRARVLDAVRANREIEAAEGGSPDGIISQRLGLRIRQARADNLLAPDDPAITMDEKALVAEADKAEAKAQAITWLKGFLPYFSEGGLAILLGLGLGFLAKGIFKVLIIFALLLIAGMEYLAYQGVLEVNWGAMAGLLQETILNATPNGDMGAIIKEKAASLGAFGTGLVLGLKK